ncbi:unnamed protein product [Adineta ricciae]|uniref:Uncharacterized protein n=1 Tax=Adineta ricciae TaxID=249248 RepID=A0A815RNI3_ADIRI|nr:unnamed protein product [Adineta ricciae]CAF1480586.1 unnamed protein product [Adineta ricciae]
MSIQRSPIFPNELLERISEELSGIELLHFAIAALNYLTISNHQLSRLLRREASISLEKEIKSLISIPNSPFVIVDEGIALLLSSYKWNQSVYGPFKLNTIEKTLKYFLITLFFVYARLWSFNPFYYDVSYLVLDIF